MRRLLIIGMLVVFTGVVLAGVNNIKDRWLQPVLFLLPAATAAWFSHYRAGSNALRDFARVSIVAALIVPPVLGYYLTYGSSTPPYGQLDYQRLYDEVKQHGEFKTILTDNVQIPGNFRLFDPSLQVIHPETPFGAANAARPTLVMWFGEATPNQRITVLINEAQIKVPETGITTTSIAYKTRSDMSIKVSYFLQN